MPVTRLPTTDGSFTANEEEKHALTKEEWMKVFWHHKPEDLPTLEAFEAECGDLFQEVPLELPVLTGKQFRARAKKKSRGAQSFDGWGAAEVAALPLVIFDEFARFFQGITARRDFCNCD